MPPPAAAVAARCLRTAVASTLLFGGCAAGPGVPARFGTPVTISGSVTYRGAPVEGASVSFSERPSPEARRAARSVRTGRDGAFRADLPPGSYFVEAGALVGGKVVFAYAGQNPVRLDKGSRQVALKAVPLPEVRTRPLPAESGAVLEGEVRFGGKPVEGAVVHVYSSADGGFRGAGIAMSPPTGPDGRFTIEKLAESFCYVVARRRRGAAAGVPLEAGELFGFFPGNPLFLADRTATTIRIEAVEKGPATRPAD